MPATDTEASVGAEDAAGNNFGNKEAITSVLFSTPAPNANPAQPDFKTEGKVFDAVAVTGPAVTSKSVSMLYTTGQFFSCTFNLLSTVSGSAQVQCMLSEKEAVWYNEGSAQAVTANQLAQWQTTALVRQRRIVFTPTGAGTVNGWITSI